MSKYFTSVHASHHKYYMVSETHKISQVKVAMNGVLVLIMFCIIVIASSFIFNDHRHQKLLVGYIGLGCQ